MRRVVTITVTYGSPGRGVVLNAVLVAASYLARKGIEPRILQVYSPGSETRVSVNGLDVPVDERLADSITEKVFEALMDEDAGEIKTGLRGVAGALFKGG